MNAPVRGQFRVKRGREKRTLPDGDDPTVILAQHGYFLARLLYPGRADEYRVERRALDEDLALEGVHLAAEGVAPGGHVDAAEGLLARDAVLEPVPELHDFLCKPSEDDKDLRSKVLSALTSKDVSASALIIGVLVGTFGVAPAIATLIAALVVQLVVKPAADEICKYWDEQLASP